MFKEWYEEQIENANSKEELDRLLKLWLKTLAKYLQRLGEAANSSAFEIQKTNIRIMEMIGTDEEYAMSLAKKFDIKSCQEAAILVEQSLVMVQRVYDKRQKVLDQEYDRIINLIRKQGDDNENASK